MLIIREGSDALEKSAALSPRGGHILYRPWDYQVTAGALFREEFLYFPGGETLKEAPDFSESECPYLQRYLLMISPIR